MSSTRFEPGVGSVPQAAHTDACITYHTSYTACLPEDEPTRIETCRRHQIFNISLEHCAFRWIALYNGVNTIIMQCLNVTDGGNYYNHYF